MAHVIHRRKMTKFIEKIPKWQKFKANFAVVTIVYVYMCM